MPESPCRIRPRAFASLAGALLLAAAAQGAAEPRQAPPGAAPVPFTVTIGPPHVVATAALRARMGFRFGLVDGVMGGVKDADRYLFFGSAYTLPTCTGTPNTQGVYRLEADPTDPTTLLRADCRALLRDGDGLRRPGAGPFDRNYLGGGPAMRLTSPDGTRQVILLTYHAEFQWGPPCGGGAMCFYGTIGMAVSIDNGASFRKLGQIIQPRPGRADWVRSHGDRSLAIGNGPFVLGDEQHGAVDPRTADLTQTYMYVFFMDHDPDSECGARQCLAVARARASEVITATFVQDTAAFPKLFRKYYKGGFEEPAATTDPSNATPSGRFTPLIKVGFSPSTLYDSTIRQVILASNFGKGIGLRASANLVDWSAPPLAELDETGQGLEVRYPSLIGDGDNASVGSGRPWLFYTHEPPGGGWKGPRS